MSVPDSFDIYRRSQTASTPVDRRPVYLLEQTSCFLDAIRKAHALSIERREDIYVIPSGEYVTVNAKNAWFRARGHAPMQMRAEAIAALTPGIPRSDYAASARTAEARAEARAAARAAADAARAADAAIGVWREAADCFRRMIEEK